MSKVLLFSDIHIHPHKKSTSRLQDCLDVIPWVFDVAKKNNIKSILFGGDFFHDRHKIDIFTYQKTFETLNQQMNSGDFELYMLLGNHDLWFMDDTSISSVFPLSLIKGVKIIDKPCRIEIENSIWDFLPFTLNPLEALATIKSEHKREYLLGHIAINDAKMHRGHYSSDIIVEHEGELINVDANVFSKYKYVFLGHFHSEQRVGKNIEYIGSPLQLSFGESFEDKHLIIFDVENNKKEYVKNEFSPKHIICNENNISEYNLDGNFVQVLIQDVSNTDIIDIKKDIFSNNNVLDLKIKQKINKPIHEEDKVVFTSLNEIDMISKYVDASKTELDKEYLKKIGEKICKDSKENV
jgi:DNA repair exonuclease SbcCD nuclease subunit